ncbi:hypothetical protein niasHS_000897 [Heterodera schachtii]|uniref:ZP domain-containing protein n=1 Tax=Heterodera schachtii TaxID=97005 RepID=A0ABD2I5A5_HETSC
MLFIFFVSIFAILAFQIHFLAFAIPENGIIGEPFVDCGGNFIEVRFDTRNPFVGVVFVEGQFKEPRCRSVFVDESAIGRGAARNAQIRLSFGTCGIKHTKREDYPRGVFLSVRLVVAFHAQYLSKLDRVYDLRCFYMEMEHELEKPFTVRMNPPTMHSKQIQMPNCRYEVLSEGPNGPPVYYATVGQMVKQLK